FRSRSALAVPDGVFQPAEWSDFDREYALRFADKHALVTARVHFVSLTGGPERQKIAGSKRKIAAGLRNASLDFKTVV
ncbi:MAG: hypothetical protein OXN84_10245, partial [Albidovulum sp.]|nr:hypothetical protein [Albidovulum sp.]